jgi:lipopolysaccharide heptosyltransferase I
MTSDRRRYLLVRLSSIGDIVHALPAAAALAEAFPDAELHWVVEKRFAVLLRGNPHIRRLIELDTLGWRKNLLAPTTLGDFLVGFADLRRFTYDAALDFQGLYKSALIARLSRARERLGFADLWLREPAAAVFYTDHVAPRGREHVIEMNLALAERLGARAGRWQFPLPRTDEDDAYVERELARLGAESFILLNPGGGWMSKRWPPENYSGLIRRLAEILKHHFVLTGSPDEEETNRRIVRESASARAHCLPTTLVQSIALARRARLFVGGDTGPLHLAAAVGTPIVAIYGPTSPARNGPFSKDDIVLWNRGPIRYTRRASAPAYLEGIGVEEVTREVLRRLERAHG